MKQMTNSRPERRTLGAVIGERLVQIGANQIPPLARERIERDVMAACVALVQRRVSAPYVGRAVARALAASAAKPEGFEGDGTSPSTSKPNCKQSAQFGIAGHPTDATNTQRAPASIGAHEPPTGERV